MILYSKIEDFEKFTKNVDLTVINNGVFFPEYTRKKSEAARFVEKAKIQEGYDVGIALKLYEDACNLYSEIVESVNDIYENVRWAKIRFSSKKIMTIVG